MVRKWEWAPARSMAAAVGCTLASGLTKRHLRFPVHREHGRVEAHVVVEPTLGGHLMAGAPLMRHPLFDLEKLDLGLHADLLDPDPLG